MRNLERERERERENIPERDGGSGFLGKAASGLSGYREQERTFVRGSWKGGGNTI